MAKDKSKSKGKKKFKAFEKLRDAEEKAKVTAGPVIEEIREGFEAVIEPESATQAPKEAKPAPIETPSDDEIYELADLFKGFADSTRLRILFALVDGGKCVADISEAAGVSQSATSHQLRSMKQADLVKFTREGKQVIYSLANDNVQAMLAQGLSTLKG